LPPPPGFILRDGLHLARANAPYRVAGANMWYAAWLGADAPFGDRPRLGRELDRLKALGLNNLRIMAAAEEARCAPDRRLRGPRLARRRPRRPDFAWRIASAG
jgi:mannan endo-1,4-beta-mannosidase